MRFLGVDWGDRRIGLALSDGEGVTAFGYGMVLAGSGAVREVARIAVEEGVDVFVVGWPLRSDTGEPSANCAAVEVFARQLHEASGLPVRFEDERWTTAAARQEVQAQGFRRGRGPRAALDRAAARSILQEHLDRLARGEPVLPGPWQTDRPSPQ